MIGNPYRGRGFKGLLKYLHEGRKSELNPHRVLWSEARNMPTTKHETVAGIMAATASLSRGVKKPLYHLPLSWPPSEQLTKETQLEIADQLISDLGLGEHQCLIVAHDDGDCPHIHLVLNTVHPETGKVWNGWRDVYRIMESLERQEKERGLQIVDRPDLEEWRTDKKNPDREKRASRGERLRAEREGETPLAKWSEHRMRAIRKNITAHFKDARSWEDLESRLASHELYLMRAGQGFRITDGSHYMTMSKIGKHAREEKLEERFEETWEDYSFTREQANSTSQDVEPPDARQSEDILDHLNQVQNQQKEKERNEKERLVREALQSYSRYKYFRSKESEVAQIGASLVRQNRAMRSNAYILSRVTKDRNEADQKLDTLFSSLFKNPRQARNQLIGRLHAGEVFDEIELTSLGKVKGWKFLNWRSKARKEAMSALRQIPKAHNRFEKLNVQMETYSHEKLVLHAKHGEQVSKFADGKGSLGNHSKRSERRLELWKEMNSHLQQLDQNDIWNSSLPEDAKEQLARGWEEHIQKRAENAIAKNSGLSRLDQLRRRREQERDDWGR